MANLRLTFDEPATSILTPIPIQSIVSGQVFNIYGFQERYQSNPAEDPLLLFLYSQGATVNLFDHLSSLPNDTATHKPEAIITNGNIFDESEILQALFQLEFGTFRPRPVFCLLDSRAGNPEFRARFFLAKAQIIELPFIPPLELTNQIEAVRRMIDATISNDIIVMLSPNNFTLNRGGLFTIHATANSAVGKPQRVQWFILFNLPSPMERWNWETLNSPCTTTCTAVISGRISNDTPFGNYSASIVAHNEEVEKSAIVQFIINQPN